MLQSVIKRSPPRTTVLSDRNAMPASSADTAAAGRSKTIAADSPGRIAVLLVDDEPALLDVAKAFLERSTGIEVTTCLSAREGIDLLMSIPFDAIVSDYQMPEMDGLAFLREVRKTHPAIPFIIFTGRGREEIVIEAYNGGADAYIQKGGEAKSQYVELQHKIRGTVRQKRAEAALKKKHEILRAILNASPNGIAFVRNRTLQWVNGALAGVLGYTPAELRGMHLKDLYENAETYERIGLKIQRDLRESGRCRLVTRFRHRQGFPLEYVIHIAPLDRGNLHYGHMIMLTDPEKKLALTRGLQDTSAFPHLELTPVIELNRDGRITYFNDAAIEAMVRYGSQGSLEEFLPSDIQEILRAMDCSHTESLVRDVQIGPEVFRVHITLSPHFGVARLSAIRKAGIACGDSGTDVPGS